MNDALIDVPVALIFFARPDVLKETFSAIKNARPSKLFLIQDGPREGRMDDAEDIKKCRDIVSDIDWKCEVHEDFSELNLGCGKRVYSGLTKAFESVDRLVIIEDDCVPGKSFLKFCEEILEKYKYDERIGLISGMNHLGIYKECTDDYFFSFSGSIWGWATWKRVWDTVDFEMSYLNDQRVSRLLLNLGNKRIVKNGKKKLTELNSGKKLSSWTYQFVLNVLLQNMLVIVPKYNLTKNIGLTTNSEHSQSSIKRVPRGLRKIYFMKSHEMEFPLKHPKFVINDIGFKKKVDRILGTGYPLVRLYRIIESVFYRILTGNFSSVVKGIKRRFAR